MKKEKKKQLSHKTNFMCKCASACACASDSLSFFLCISVNECVCFLRQSTNNEDDYSASVAESLDVSQGK